MQGEGFAFADAGADEDFDEVGEGWVGGSAAVQEADGVLDGPDLPFCCRGPWDDRGAGGVVGEPAVADGVAEGAGERGEAAVDGDLAASGGELGVGEGGDMGVAEVVEPDRAEGGDQVVGDVVAVADVCGGLEDELLVLEPGREVVGEGLVGVGAEAGGLALDHPAQSCSGCFGGGVAAAADVVASMVGGGEVEGEGPGAVIGVGGELGAVGSELLATLVAAAAPAVDVPGVGCGAHGDHFQRGSCEQPCSWSPGGRQQAVNPRSHRTHKRVKGASDLGRSLVVATSARGCR